jgi:serine/threonine protein kinase
MTTALFGLGPKSKAFEGGQGSLDIYKHGAERIVVKRFRRTDEEPKRAEALAEATAHWQAYANGQDHVVGLRGIAQTSRGDPLLILDYAPHGDVKELLDKLGPIDDQTKDSRLLLFTDMVKCMAHAHANGVVHRDIKFENFLVGQEGKLLLCDFGASGTALAEVTASGTDTPDFLAPELEQARRGNVNLINGKADTWSLGVALNQLVHGTQPFHGGEYSSEGFKKIRDFAAMTPEARRSKLSLVEGNGLDDLIARMLDPDPLNRPSMAEVLKDAAIQPFAEPKTEQEETRVTAARMPLVVARAEKAEPSGM